MSGPSSTRTNVSVFVRLLDLFVRNMFGSMKHHAVHAILGAAAIAYDFARFGRAFSVWVDHAKEVMIPLLWALIVAVIWHSIASGIQLIELIRAETSAESIEVDGPLYGAGGQRIKNPVKPSKPPAWFRAKVWASVMVLVSLSLIVFVATLISLPTSPVPSSVAEPRIEPSYDLHVIGLPLVIAPFSAAYILRIHDNRTVDAITYPNPNSQVSYWPSKVKLFPPESVGEMRLSNHGSVSVFNATYEFIISVSSQGAEGGATNLSIRLPLIDLLVNGRPWVGYIVNQSTMAAMIHLSRDMAAQVQGEPTRRRFDLQPRDLTFFDKVPLMGISSHKWSGDRILPPFWPANKGH